jgi:hypothetical protein
MRLVEWCVGTHPNWGRALAAEYRRSERGETNHALEEPFVTFSARSLVPDVAQIPGKLGVHRRRVGPGAPSFEPKR